MLSLTSPRTIFGIDLRNRKHLAIVIMILFAMFVVGFTALTSFGYIHTLTPRPVQLTTTSATSTTYVTSATSSTTSTRRSGSELISVDATWNRYINYSYGISILVPITAYNYAADCTLDSSGALPSYRPQPASSPVKTYDDTTNNNFYIAFDSFAVLSNPTVQAGVTYFSDCEKQTTTLPALRAGELGSWKFYTASVNTEQDITNFIRSKYGASCDLGEIKDTTTSGMKSVTVRDGGPESDCWINFVTAIYYSPAKKRVVAWDLGQSITFASQSSDERAQDYDSEMRESFRFVD